MTKRRLGRSELWIDPLVFGTNVIGGTCDEARSFEVLDAFVDEGFSAIDTADMLGEHAPVGILAGINHARRSRKYPETDLAPWRDEKAAERVDVFQPVVDVADRLQVIQMPG